MIAAQTFNASGHDFGIQGFPVRMMLLTAAILLLANALVVAKDLDDVAYDMMAQLGGGLSVEESEPRNVARELGAAADRLEATTDGVLKLFSLDELEVVTVAAKDEAAAMHALEGRDAAIDALKRAMESNALVHYALAQRDIEPGQVLLAEMVGSSRLKVFVHARP